MPKAFLKEITYIVTCPLCEVCPTDGHRYVITGHKRLRTLSKPDMELLVDKVNEQRAIKFQGSDPFFLDLTPDKRWPGRYEFVVGSPMWDNLSAVRKKFNGCVQQVRTHYTASHEGKLFPKSVRWPRILGHEKAVQAHNYAYPEAIQLTVALLKNYIKKPKGNVILLQELRDKGHSGDQMDAKWLLITKGVSEFYRKSVQNKAP